MDVFWTETAKLSFSEELDFIHRKWGNKEVEKFILLSEEFIEILKSGHLEGKPTDKKDVKLYVISKQTTLVYKLNNSQKRIELILFWNNLKNPKEFEKLVNR
ncbi:hypothetical protein [Confluentibacter citreus]|uniref:hypothetical protein n=1 Tax=Confluentibacter citreus TaxID=2007307 RepID=UPI000C28B7FA|nr:hypothetical protein [Confluentibacter citreus]